jgi:hypothetical protein
MKHQATRRCREIQVVTQADEGDAQRLQLRLGVD